MKRGPKKQSEVDEDYSNKKAPNQVAFPTFWSAVEPYLRDVREDDLAMLGFKVGVPLGMLRDTDGKGHHRPILQNRMKFLPKDDIILKYGMKKMGIRPVHVRASPSPTCGNNKSNSPSRV